MLLKKSERRNRYEADIIMAAIAFEAPLKGVGLLAILPILETDLVIYTFRLLVF